MQTLRQGGIRGKILSLLKSMGVLQLTSAEAGFQPRFLTGLSFLWELLVHVRQLIL